MDVSDLKAIGKETLFFTIPALFTIPLFTSYWLYFILTPILIYAFFWSAGEPDFEGFKDIDSKESKNTMIAFASGMLISAILLYVMIHW